MSQKAAWIIIIIAAIGFGIFKLTSHPAPIIPEGPVACTMDAKICPDGSAVGRTGPDCQFAACPAPAFTWKFFVLQTFAATEFPATQVNLMYNDKDYDLGVFDGTCSEISKTSWPKLPGEIDGAVCYFAGGGTEIGIFEENNSYVVKTAEMSEGDAETAGTRGDWKTLKKLD